MRSYGSPVANEFWRTPEKWPNDPPRYVFLARGFDEIGRARFGDKWPRGHLIEASRELSDDELSADDREEAEDARRMWGAVKNEIAKQCLEGRLLTAVRPIEGGEITDLKPEMWNAENLERRFSRCQMSWETPFAKLPFPGTHWIYLKRESLDNYLAGQPHGITATQTPIHMSPYIKLMLHVVEFLNITPDNQPKKADVMDAIRKAHWTGEKPLSKAEIEWMATLIREPESKLGRARKK